VLKGIAVEQSSYHGGSLNGKVIKMAMNNETYLCEKFSPLLKSGNQDSCELSNDAIEALCQ
jgi:hypothetical protein